MNPFISFCLYVAARVFIQYLKSRPTDEQVRASLQFLLTAMGHMKKLNPLTESFLVQLDIDLNGTRVLGSSPNIFQKDHNPSPEVGSRCRPVSTPEEQHTPTSNRCPSGVFPDNFNKPLDIPTTAAPFYSMSPDSNQQSPDSFGGTGGSATPPSNSDGSYSQQQPPDYFDQSCLIDDSMTEQFSMGAMGEKEWNFYGMEGSAFDQELGSLGPVDSDGLLMSGVSGMNQELGDYFTEGMA
jgi:hypothetical protein